MQAMASSSNINDSGPNYVRFDETIHTPRISSNYPPPSSQKGFCVKHNCLGSSGRVQVWDIRRKVDRCGIAMLILGTLLLISAATAPLLVDHLVGYEIDQQTVVKAPKGKAYDTFVQSGENLGVKIGFSVSWFNLTNAVDVLDGARPILEEVGPYIYREYRRKLNVTFLDDGDQVSFVLRKFYVWDEEANAGSGLLDTEDMITSVHPVIQVVQQQLQTVLKIPFQEVILPEIEGGVDDISKETVGREIDASGIWKLAYKMILCEGNPAGISPFTTQSARDLFWGYHDDSVLLTMQALVNAAQTLASRVGKSLPLPVVPEAFPGLYTNLTSDKETAKRIGPNVVRTGKIRKDVLQEYTAFQNMTNVYACPDPTTGPLPAEGEMPSCYIYQAGWDEETAAAHGYIPQWASEEANQVKGTDGSMFHHPLTTDSIFTFQEDYRRYVELVYVGDQTDFYGLTLRRYVFKDEDFRNDSSMSEGWYQDNLPTGLGNLTHIGGFPLYLSKPHLLESDPYVSDMVVGLTPDPIDHLTYIDVEPRSGVTFRTHKRVQINAGLSDLAFPPVGRKAARAFTKALGMPVTERAETCLGQHVEWKFGDVLYHPLAWYDENFAMTEDFTKSFKQQVYGSASVAKYYQVVGPIVAGLMILVAIIMMVVSRRRKRREQEEEDEEGGAYSALSPAGDNKGGVV